MPASRPFSMTAIDSGSPPLAFCICARRNAADRPPGPAPTIRTSTSRTSRSGTAIGSRLSALCAGSFLQLRNDGRRQLEQVALNPVVGDLEDWRLGVLVDGDDRACALHADEMLNGAGNAEGHVELR